MTTSTRRRTGAHDRISNIAENYLQSLYKLREEGLRPSAGNLTDFIRRLPREEGVGTSLPSILGMLRRMQKEGLVTIQPNKEVELTTRGEAAAESIVRRHRLAERLVVDILGLDVARAHIEAHRLEHAISPDLEECIQERLGRPATNPFGRPIPGNAPKAAKDNEVCLADASEGKEYVVDRIPEEDAQLLAFLIGCGVMPGARLRVTEQSKFRGVLVFNTDTCESSMGYDAARFVWLRNGTANGAGGNA
ncbi:MAG: metal-dependent transcriptional regulator [Chloroflexota bacterium]|nr:metal-dependent transcriptional regulator [Chloroflexota bacterium]